MSAKGQLKLTTRGRYAVMAMVELAQKGQSRPVPLSEISERGNISLSYLEQLFAGLRRSGLVKSHRGPGGGYMLAKDPADILISDVMHAAEDSVPAKRPSQSDTPDNYGNSQTQALWSHIGEVLHACMRKVSLDDVLEQRLRDNSVAAKMFDSLS